MSLEPIQQRSFWALADQGIVSIGNFLTTLIVARALPGNTYGAYALLFGVALALNTVHYSLVVYPLSLQIAKAKRSEVCSLLLAGIVATLLLIAVVCPLGAAATVVMRRLDLLPWFIGAVIAWQLQEMCRRTLLASGRFFAAMLGDGLSYPGQAVVTYYLFRSGAQNLRTVFAAMFVTSIVAAILQGVQAGLPSRPLHFGVPLISCWTAGKWILFSNAVNVVSLQVVPWSLVMTHGTATAGDLQAAMNVVGVINPVLLGIGTAIMPAVARAKCRGEGADVGKVAILLGALGGALVAPYLVTVLVAPKLILQLLYGHGSHYKDLGTIARLLAGAFALNYLGQVVISLLAGLGESRLIFLTQAATAVTAIGMGFPLASAGGLLGAAGAIAVIMTARCAAGFRYVGRALRSADTLTQNCQPFGLPAV